MNPEDKSLTSYRKTTQNLMPVKHPPQAKGEYGLYPAFELEDGLISRGYDALANKIKDYSTVIIDGYIGVFWDDMRQQLEQKLNTLDVKAKWVDVSKAMLHADQIDKKIAPFLGGDDPVFGTRYDGELRDFFSPVKLDALSERSNAHADITILYGCGAGLAG